MTCNPMQILPLHVSRRIQ